MAGGVIDWLVYSFQIRPLFRIYTLITIWVSGYFFSHLQSFVNNYLLVILYAKEADLDFDRSDFNDKIVLR